MRLIMGFQTVQVFTLYSLNLGLSLNLVFQVLVVCFRALYVMVVKLLFFFFSLRDQKRCWNCLLNAAFSFLFFQNLSLPLPLLLVDML